MDAKEKEKENVKVCRKKEKPNSEMSLVVQTAVLTQNEKDICYMLIVVVPGT